jgi:hypothetical protein
MRGGIFVSYRREDAAASAGRLCDHLLRHFPRDHIFFDVDTIEPGLDFVKVLDEHVSKCDVLLAVIGRDWATIEIEGEQRLSLPSDFVRIEVESALKRDIRVVPVLVDGAEMPRERQLPEELKPLARRQGLVISHASFAADTERLINVLKRHFDARKAAAEPGQDAPKPESQRPIRVEPVRSAAPSPEIERSAPAPAASPPTDAAALPKAEATSEPPRERAPEPTDPLPTFMLDVAAGAVLDEARREHAEGGPSGTTAKDDRLTTRPADETRIANLLTALLLPTAIGLALLYMSLDFSPWYDWAPGLAESRFYSGLFASLIIVLPMLLVVIVRSGQGDRPIPFLLFATLGWTGVLFVGAPVSSYVIGIRPSDGPWPLFLLAAGLALAAAVLLAKGHFVRGRPGLIYGIYFSPVALFSVIAVPETVSLGQMATAALAIGYLLLFVVTCWRLAAPTQTRQASQRDASSSSGFGHINGPAVADAPTSPAVEILAALPYPLVLVSGVFFALIDAAPLFSKGNADDPLQNGLAIGSIAAALLVGACLLSPRARAEPARFLLAYSAGWCVVAAALVITIASGGPITGLVPVTTCAIALNIAAAVGVIGGVFAPRAVNALVVGLYSLPWLVLLLIAPAGSTVEAVLLAASAIAAAGAFVARAAKTPL